MVLTKDCCGKEGDHLLCDREILALLVKHPEKGLEKIMDRYMAFVCVIVHGKLGGICNRHDIEECVGDIFYELYRTRSGIDLEKGPLKAYLAVLAKRRAIDVFRKQLSHAGDISLDESMQGRAAADTDVEQAVLDSETADLLIREIKALGQTDSQIIIRKYYFGQATKEIAKSLGLKENTVDKKVSRALVKLKQALGGEL
jgi:RNA polymerase sigma-70 factor (ECF subfamily)